LENVANIRGISFYDKHVLGYFAYPLSTTCIPTYRQPTNSLLGDTQFNTHITLIWISSQSITKCKHGKVSIEVSFSFFGLKTNQNFDIN